MVKKWWMERIGYQIYPKSFKDSNGDGIGDLNGIIEKLEYLSNLGVNLIWICPFYDSPMDDNGYDVRDFFNVAKEFGTMDDVKKLIQKAKDLDIKIILDFVLNHTSDEHPWFIESRKSKDNPYRDYYIWHEGKIKDGNKVEPTNWGSFFGGSAWQYDDLTDSYFMKIFSSKMPDLNWKNEKVHDEMIKIAHTWLDLGIDGFRIDAVSHLDRAQFEDTDVSDDPYPLDWYKFSNLPKVHDYLKKLNQEVFQKRDVLTIGEVGGAASIDEGLKYAGFDRNELSMVFNFDHNWCNNLWEISHPKHLKTDVLRLKKVFLSWQEAFKNKGWLPLNWLNHDQPRLMSQYGDRKYPIKSAKMLATLLHMLKGTPFIYQGEEIGMTNYPFDDVSDFKDISSIAAYYRHLEKEPDDPVKAIRKAGMSSRDNARTPMQWDASLFAGFTDKNPWLKVNPNYKKVNVDKNLKDENSLWYHYQKLISLRKKSAYHDVITYGDVTFLDIENPNHITYLRKNEAKILLCIHSFSRKKQTIDLNTYHIEHVVISNYQKLHANEDTLILKPYESVVLEVKEKL
ncbi:MAG: glucohydrolase [Tenericutes bacterium HGW-Tenericutes-6]|nr:MAG: glucohydrolase [Tenericutes bacterium HGW-Tenericutes-6]